MPIEFPAEIECSDELKPLLGKVVGWVKINKPWTHHISNYECAAWWKDVEIQQGIYPLILKKKHLNPYSLHLETKLTTAIVDDHFPSLWGGVSISNKPYVCTSVGKVEDIHWAFNLVEAISVTGNFDGDKQFVVNPFIWGAIIRAAEQTMNGYYDYLVKNWESRKVAGDCKYNSALNAVGHAGKNLDNLRHAIEAIRTRLRYMEEATDYSGKLYGTNTSWAFSSAA